MRIYLVIVLVAVNLQSYAFTLNGNFKNGWTGPTLKVNVNLTNCPSGFLSAFQDAADLWNTVSTSFLKIELGSTSSTTTPAALIGVTAADSPVIVCDNSFQATTGGDEDSVAGVGFSSVAGGSHLSYGGVILNTSSGLASINSMNKEEMSIVIAHELGHALGFGHSADNAALMYFNASYKEDLRLSQDDWDAMTYLYPRNELSGDDLLACGELHSNLTIPPWIYLMLLTPVGVWFYFKQRNLKPTALN